MLPGETSGREEAERLLEEHLAGLERGEEADIEALCASHPELASELRRAAEMRPILEQFGAEPAELSGSTAFYRAVERAVGPAPAADTVGEGDTLGDFRLVSLIGRGGMGEVWEAEQLSLSRRVALKLLLPDRVHTRGLAFFAREARAGGRLAHPGIAAVHGTGEDRGQHWIAMELVEGACDLRRSLDDLRENVELPRHYYRHVASFTAALADALGAAHDAGVIHRDLKPSNVLVTPDDRPVVTDFGLARLVDEDSISIEGDLAGSYFYMSPEQVAAKRIGIDHRSDVFSLGVLLFEMLTLVRPFEGDTSQQVASKILLEDPPDPRTLRSLVPADLAVICAVAMEKNPGRRFQTMGALAADLRRHLAHEPILSRPAGSLLRLSKWARRNPTKSVAGAVAAASFVAISWLAWGLRARGVELEGMTLEARESAARFEAVAADLSRSNEELGRQREEADRARQEEQRAREEAEQVAAFQARQLSRVDVVEMGRSIREAVLERAWEAGERARREPEILGAERVELEELLAGSDFTGLAKEILDENVFEGTLEALTEFEDPRLRARLLQTLASTMHQLEMLERAEGPQRQALEIWRGLLGDEHATTLTSIESTITLLRSQGELTEAESLARGVLETRRRVLGDEDPATLTAMISLAELLLRQDLLSEAEPFIAEALEVARRELGDDDWRTLTAVSRMGVLLQSRGALREAEPYFREALEGQRRALGDDHRDTQEAVAALGYLLRLQGRWSEAEPYYREALETRRRLHGDENRDTLASIGNLGVLFRSQGKFSEAEPYLREALETNRRVRGDDHPDTLRSINDFCTLLMSLGKMEEAERYFREALGTSRRVLGDDHPSTLIMVSNLGFALMSQDEFDEAEPYFREALETQRSALGEEHPSTLIAINNMGTLYESWGMPDEAERFYLEALQGMRDVLGSEHLRTMAASRKLGRLLLSQGRLQEAEGHLREAQEKSRAVLGEDHGLALASTLDLGQVLHGLGELAEAESHYREALAGFQRTLGEEHPNTERARLVLDGLRADQVPGGAPPAGGADG